MSARHAAPGEAAPVPSPTPARSPSSEGRVDAGRSVFAGDPRLQAPLTAGYGDRPLGEILAALGRALKLPLRAERDVADDRTTLFVQARPAAECLLRLAEQFQFQWRRRGKGYELWQDSASRRREAALRERDLAAQLKALEAQMQRVAESNTDEGSAAARARELQRSLQGIVTALPPAEQKRRMAEWSRTQGEAVAPAAVTVYQSLKAAQIRRLVDTGELFLASPDGTLSPALAERVSRLATELSPEPLLEPIQAHVDIRLDEGPLEVAKPPASPTPRLSLRFTLTSLRRLEKTAEGQPDTRPTFGPKRPPSQAIPQGWSPELPPEPPATVEAPMDDPLLRQAITLRFPRAAQRSAAPAAGLVSPRGVLMSDTAWPAGWVTLGEMAEALHTAAGLDLITDSFVRTRMDPAKLAGSRTVGQVLDLLAREWRYTWRREGTLILLRSSVAHWDRVQSVPERVLAPWRARVTEKSEPSLNDLAELAAALSDRQCRGMQGYWGWYLWNDRSRLPPPTPGGFYPLRQHFRLWAGLSPAQRQRALSPAGLPVSEMSRLQGALFMAALASEQYDEYLPLDRRRVPTVEEIAAGGLRVRVGRLYEQEFAGTRPGSEVIFRSSRFSDPKNPKALEPLEPDDPDAFASITWSPIGSPLALGEYRFQYHLGGEEKPARTVAIELLAPRRPA